MTVQLVHPAFLAEFAVVVTAQAVMETPTVTSSPFWPCSVRVTIIDVHVNLFGVLR